MTTPGRTHISWQTETDHVRELISYISFLEAKLSYLQCHHERCNTWDPLVGANLPYLPPHIIDTGDEANDEADNESCIPQVTSTPAAASYISITAKLSSVKSFEGNPRWKQIIDQIATGWDKSSSWIERRNAIGLNSISQNRYALTAILSLQEDISPQLLRDESSPDVSQAWISAAETLITLARKYALGSKAFHRNTALDFQVHIFRDLVFASLCVVMEHQGVPIDAIDGLMRICISNSGSANLYRLRRGALWINRVISGTMMKKVGWGHGSTEFILLSGRPVCQYGLLWESCSHSFPYLCDQLARISCTVEVPITDPDWIPLSIPLIIKQLVGDTITLEQICMALDYNIGMA